jgi:hypothetical protein
MFYLSQPLQGLLLKTSQLFSGRVKSLISFSLSLYVNTMEQKTKINADDGKRELVITREFELLVLSFSFSDGR